MRKNQTSYSDAMNEWAAKQSGLRKRRNRLLHPKPDQPGPLRALGYLVRIAIVIFLVWLVGAKLSANYYNGDAFNQKLRAEIKAMTRADALDASDFTWRGSQASCEKLIATGGESAFFRNLEATQVSFSLPLLKRLRPSWAIDHLSIERLSLALNSGSQPEGGVGASPLAPQPLVPAGLLPSPDLSRLILARITCDATDVSWGHSSATRGALKGAEIGLFSASEDWHLDIEGGVAQQNWLRGMAIESLTVRRKGGRLILSDSEIRPGGSEETGTLEGEIVLGGLPQLDLRLELPAVETSDLLPEGSDLAQFFNGLLRLSTQLSGSIHGPTGVETSSKATLTRGMFGKIPVFEAIDELLGTNTFQRFSPDTGEVEFTTAGGRLEVSRFECKSRSASALLRGTFSYASDEISGRLQLGVRPSLLSNNEVAMSFFTERAEGYVWIGIPLKGTLEQATRPQQAEILAALRRENP